MHCPLKTIRNAAFWYLLLSAVLDPAWSAPAPAVKTINAWPNPGAEAGTTGAIGGSPDATGVSLSQQQADAWRGRCSFELRFTAGPGGAAALVFGGAETVVPVTAGKVCFFRVAGRMAEGAMGTALELRARWLDDTGRLVAETPHLSYAASSARRTWSVLEGWDTVPAGAARAALALYAVNAAGVTVIRADGVQITPDAARIPAYVEGDEPGCSWLGASHASASSGPTGVVNLVPNPSFEHGIEGWRSGSGAGGKVRPLERDHSWGSSGTNSLRLAGNVTNRPNSYISALSQPIPVVGGQEYTLRAVVNVAALPAGARVSLALGWLDSSGTYLFAESLADAALTTALGVRPLAVTKPAPRHAASALAIVSSTGGIPGEYDVSADAFSLIADSGAAPSRPFWVGFNDQLMNGGPLTREQDIDHDVQLGVNCVRLPINLRSGDLYKQVWPAPEAPINLEPVAPTIDAFFKAGVRLLLLCPITPWMLKDRHLDPAHYASVGKLTAAFVRRWPQIIGVEVGNEPNTSHFWPPAPDPVAFVRYLETIYRAVKAVDPKMPVLSPTCNAPLTRNTNRAKTLSLPDFMRAFYQAGGGRYCDALSIHPYPCGATSGSDTNRNLDFWTGAEECMRQIREIRDAFHDQGKPIWITELGSPIASRVTHFPITRPITEDQQARSTALLHGWARRQADVPALIYHLNADKPDGPWDFGIFEATGRLRPAYFALQAELRRTAPPYFDGDTPGCRWLGEPGGSPSLRPNPGQSAAAPPTPTRRPNILFCLADDWSWPHASAYGDKVVKTPAFDRVAQEGVLFTHAFCATPSCTASRAAILTGQYPHRLEEGAHLFGFLPKKFPVYPDLLEAAGYHVGLTGAKGWAPGNYEAGGYARNPAGPRYPDFAAFLKSVPAGKPFCLWFGSLDPHRGYEPGSGKRGGLKAENVVLPPYWPDAPEIRGDVLDYYWEVQRFDREIGQMLELLEQAGQLDNTIVVITGDNGWPFPRCKANVYDGGTRVPLAVRWPAKIRAGRTLDDFVNLSDLAPTFLEAAGLQPSPEMTGQSLLGLLTGTEPPGRRSAVFLERERHALVRPGQGSYPTRAVRTHEFLYVRNLRPDRWPAGDPEGTGGFGPYGDCDAGPTRKYLLDHRGEPAVDGMIELCFGKRPAEELYDLKKDPHQIHNVAGRSEYAVAQQELRARLDGWMRQTQDPRAVHDDDRWDRYPYFPFDTDTRAAKRRATPPRQ